MPHTFRFDHTAVWKCPFCGKLTDDAKEATPKQRQRPINGRSVTLCVIPQDWQCSGCEAWVRPEDEE